METNQASRRSDWRALVAVLVRMIAALTGGVVLFAVWVAAVLTGMPRPPAPPSFAVTLTAPVVVAAGFALGLLAGERLTGRRRAGFLAPYLWALAGCLVGAVTMFPLGGMMAGFGILGCGAASLLVREALRLRD